MRSYYEEAAGKLSPDQIKGQKEKVMAKLVAQTLKNFCEQDEEFAQAVVQGGSFQACMSHVATGIGSSISDLDAYKKAVQFYFPGAEIRMQMTIDLIGGAEPKSESGKAEGIILNLEDFL